MSNEEQGVSQNSEKQDSALNQAAGQPAVEVNAPVTLASVGGFDHSLLRVLMLTVLTCISLIALYHFLNLAYLTPGSRIGTVDLGAIVKVREKQFTDLISRSNVTDAG
jgi:hypothetical protein